MNFLVQFRPNTGFLKSYLCHFACVLRVFGFVSFIIFICFIDIFRTQLNQITHRHIFRRFMESGCFKGFMETEGRKEISTRHGIPFEDCFLWPVYNHSDIKQQQRQPKRTGKKKRYFVYLCFFFCVCFFFASKKKKKNLGVIVSK